jgi:FKBP-type peptidyl-prolyl cis-trans isomerase
MSFEVNKGKNFIYIIPIIILILIIYLMLYRDGDLDDKLSEDLRSDIITEEKETEKLEDKEFIKINKEEKMENLEIGKKYTTDSGLVYEVISLGDGEKPEASNIVEVHYHGTLEDGTVFDSSVQRGQTIEFGLNQVISG